MTTRQPLSTRSANVDNLQQPSLLHSHSIGSTLPNTPTKLNTPMKSPRHSRHGGIGPRISNNIGQSLNPNNNNNNNTTNQRLTRQVSLNASRQSTHSNNSRLSDDLSGTNTRLNQQQQQQSSSTDFTHLYHLRTLPRSPLPIEQLMAIFEQWLNEYRINRVKLEQIREKNTLKARLFAENISTNTTNNAVSPVAITTNESASIQALFTPVFFQSIFYTFRAIISKNHSVITLEHLDTVIEIILYGLHLSDNQIKFTSCILLREILQTTAFSTIPSNQTTTTQQSLLQRSVIGSVLKPIINNRGSVQYSPVYDDLEIIVRLLCQYLHFALIPELCNLIQQHLDQVYTSQLLSYVRVLFYSFQCGRANLVQNNGIDNGIKFKQNDVNNMLFIIAQLCTYQGFSSGSSSSSLTSTTPRSLQQRNTNMYQQRGDSQGEIRIYGGALLRAIGSTFPLEKTMIGIKSISYNYQVVIGDVCARVLKNIDKNRSGMINDEGMVKRLLYSVKNNATIPHNLPTFDSCISNGNFPNLNDGTGNALLEFDEFDIRHTFQPLNCQNNEPNISTQDFYCSLFDQEDNVLYIPYLLVGQPQGNTRGSSTTAGDFSNNRGNNKNDVISGDKNSNKRDKELFSLSEALSFRSVDKLNQSDASIMSTLSSLHESASVISQRTVYNDTNQTSNTNNNNTKNDGSSLKQSHIEYVTETVTEHVRTPTIIGCFSAEASTKQKKSSQTIHAPFNHSMYTAIDKDADVLISLYKLYKTNKESLTMANFDKMMSLSQKITKNMFQLSSVQLKMAQEEAHSDNIGTTTTTTVPNTRKTTAPKRISQDKITTQRPPSSNSSIDITNTTNTNGKRILINRESYDIGSDSDDSDTIFDQYKLPQRVSTSSSGSGRYNLRSSTGSSKRQRF